MDDAIGKSRALIEALAYIRRFRDRVVVVKLGGSVMDNESSIRAVLTDVVFMATVGMRPILVHGGGNAITEAMNKAGLDAQFVQGRRYTDERTLAIAEHVLVDQINAQIIEIISRLGCEAMGLHSLSSCVIFAEQLFLTGESGRRIDIGLVGNVTSVNGKLLRTLCEADVIPVIAPIARDTAGGKLNINADTAAGQIAAAVVAEKLVILSDTHGIRTDAERDDSLAEQLNEAQIRKLMQDKVIEGGMLPKVDACLSALDAGVSRAHIIDGRISHSLLLEIYTDQGIGTLIVK